MSFGIKRDATDADFSNYIRKRDDYTCQRCHRKYDGPCQAIQCAHIFSRANKSTRWDPENAVTLCHGCHAYWGREPIEMYEWYKGRFGVRVFENLHKRSRIPTKVDKVLIRMGLKQMMRELEAKEDIIGKH